MQVVILTLKAFFMIKKVIFIIVEVQKITFVGDYFAPKGYFNDKKGRKDYQIQQNIAYLLLPIQFLDS